MNKDKFLQLLGEMTVPYNIAKKVEEFIKNDFMNGDNYFATNIIDDVFEEESYTEQEIINYLLKWIENELLDSVDNSIMTILSGIMTNIPFMSIVPMDNGVGKPFVTSDEAHVTEYTLLSSPRNPIKMIEEDCVSEIKILVYHYRRSGEEMVIVLTDTKRQFNWSGGIGEEIVIEDSSWKIMAQYFIDKHNLLERTED